MKFQNLVYFLENSTFGHSLQTASPTPSSGSPAAHWRGRSCQAADSRGAAGLEAKALVPRQHTRGAAQQPGAGAACPAAVPQTRPRRAASSQLPEPHQRAGQAAEGLADS